MAAPPNEAAPTSMPSLPPPPPTTNNSGPPPPMDYRYGPPPYGYDPYYDMRYDPYGPPPPPGPHPPPRYSPEGYRNRYAYPPPPRVSPRSMYNRPPPPHYMRPYGRMPPRRPSPIQTRDDGKEDGSTGSDKENKMEVCSTGKREGDSKGDAVDLTVAVTASGSEDKGEKTPGKGGFMEAAVDNIIAAAEQIEKRDTPPSCPAEKKATKDDDESPASAPGSANDTDKSEAPSSAAPSPTDPQASPPPPSFHRYSTSPVMNHPPQTLSHPHPMGPPGHGHGPPPPGPHGPPPHGPHGPPPPGPHGPPPHGPPGYNYDPYYDYRYDYFDSYYPPPPPYDHPPHCQCQYCSPAKRRAPSYPPPPPAWDYDYNLDLSSPDEPPNKKRRRDKRPYNTYSNATKHKAHSRSLDPAQEEAEATRVKRLAKEVEDDPSLYRAVLLHMALEKESPKKKPSFDVEEVLGGFAQPSAGGSLAGSPNSMDLPSPHGFGVENRGMIGEGFYWKDYPLLENVLRKSMDEYYEMSENCPQSKQQQQFNNRLVSKVYHTAIAYGYTFDPIAYTGGSTPLTERKKSKQKDPNHDFEPLPPGFNYKKLRDRIRCYYKTHVQNSKKRLTTMLKNPTKPKNREILLRVIAEVRSEGYVGPLSGNWDGPKTKKTKSKVTPSVTFSSDDDFGLGSFSADSHSPTEAERVMVESTNHQASPFRRMEHAQILSSMKDQVSL